MRLSLSTNWCNRRLESGEAIAEKALELAVKGMLPKNSLGRQMFRKLHVYAGADHEQTAQQPEAYTF